MALTAKRKAELARMTLPSEAEIRVRAERFRNTAGLTLQEMSLATGYSASSLSVFLNGHYDGALTENHDASKNTLNIRAALKQYMDLWEGAQSEPLLRAPRPTKDLLEVQAICRNALEEGWAYVVDGPPGTQKTFSLRAAEREINSRRNRRAIYVYARVNHAPQGFLREICNTAGIPNRGTIDQILRKLKFFLAEKRTLLIIDEAQHLAHDGLEVLRQLLEQAGFGAVLAGSHDLTERLKHWQMTQWHSRVRRTLYLDGPSVAEARGIVRAELEPLLGPHSDTECDLVLDGCWSTAQRMDHSGDKPRPRKFRYISARDLFFTIEGIHQQMRKAVAEPRQDPSARNESAA